MDAELKAYVAAHRVLATRTTLEDGLVRMRLPAYIRARLWVFAALLLCVWSLHVLEVKLLFHVFSGHSRTTAVWARTATWMSTAIIWGGLEPMRARIRANRQSIYIELATWLPIAIYLAIAIGIGGCVWLVVHLWRLPFFLPADLFVLSCLCRIAIDIVVSVLQAGVYAQTRIYRPPWLSFVVEGAGFLGLLALYHWLGAWAYGFGFLLATAISRLVTLYTVLNMYRRLSQSLDEFAWLRLPTVRDFRAIAVAGVPALANLITRASTYVTLLPFATHLFGHARSTGQQLAWMQYLLIPVLGASATWPQTFYFDWNRLRDASLIHLRRRLLRAVTWTSPVAATVLLLFTWLSFVLLRVRFDKSMLLVLFAFLIVRCLFAVRLLWLFTHGRYAPMMIAGAVQLVLFAGVPSQLARHGLSYSAVALGVSIAALAYVIVVSIPREAGTGPWAWLQRLRAQPSDTWLVEVDVSRKVGAQVMRAWPTKLARYDVANFAPGQLLLRTTTPPQRREIVVGLCAQLTSVHAPAHFTDGDAAAQSIATRFAEPGYGDDLKSLRAQFATDFPDGIRVDLARPTAAPPLPATLPAKWLVYAAGRAAAAPLGVKGNGFTVGAFAPRGAATELFLMPGRYPHAKRLRFLRALAAFNTRPE